MRRIGLAALALVLSAPAWVGAEAGHEADNTGKNVRDREERTLTPMDQSNKKEDVDVTANIRKALMDDDTLSTNARNVKIITRDGIVTLRGPVESEQERVAIARTAQSVAGVRRVDNQLEIDTH
jgi:hyperosmotically inducible periplasmic protein